MCHYQFICEAKVAPNIIQQVLNLPLLVENVACVGSQHELV